MKTILGLLFILISVTAQAQVEKYPQSDEEVNTKTIIQAPKKTYKILVKNKLTATENFELVGRTLAENDFVIEIKDKEFKTIKTAAKNIGKTTKGYRLIFSMRDHEISVTGQATLASFSIIVKKGQGGSFIQLCFARMQEFALKLGADLVYITE